MVKIEKHSGNMLKNKAQVKDSHFDFSKDVLEGLNSSPKSLKSCYLYDEKGDRLFQAKMRMSEYYLTRCEYDIFSKYKDDIIDILTQGSESLNLIELGAGDGYKTKILLKDYGQNSTNTRNITYIPIDISANILKGLKDNFLLTCPNLPINPLAGDYIWAL
ncbi:MAG: L-histidine N(alpha)-methyltransferase [Okeania sp. SIO3B3]|nr:L-histidine N(alpha)-methyltransferase [Okeania sp. SIO3B3]